jgi:hypothetical protein
MKGTSAWTVVPRGQDIATDELELTEFPAPRINRTLATLPGSHERPLSEDPCALLPVRASRGGPRLTLP